MSPFLPQGHTPSRAMKAKRATVSARKAKANGLIAFLTDFGDMDHYVGTAKGVLYTVNPRATVVDITHNVAPHNVREAAYLLWASYRFFPDGTVVLAVVDPGVGSGRRIVVVETPRHCFVAPDNGLLDLVISTEEIVRAVEVMNPERFGVKPISTTFHGRDIFAPLAARLSKGEPPAKFGRHCVLAPVVSPLYDPDRGMTGVTILHIDTFGNIVTNVPGRFFDDSHFLVGSNEILDHIQNYAESTHDRPCMIVGSSGLIEIVLRGASAAEKLRVSPETRITLKKLVGRGNG